MCTIGLRHRVKCKFFVVLGDSSALLGIPDVKPVDILRIMCEVMGEPHESSIFTPRQHKHPIAIAVMQTKPNRSKEIVQMSMVFNANMSDNFRLSINRLVDKGQVMY